MNQLQFIQNFLLFAIGYWEFVFLNEHTVSFISVRHTLKVKKE